MLDFHKYKNIIFDLGGVILNINYSLTVNAFKELGFKAFSNSFSQYKQLPFFDLYDKGKISSDDFRKEIKKEIRINITDNEIDRAWNAMLLDLPNARLNLLSKLKATHRTFLLSNTNEIHITQFHTYLQKTFNQNDLTTYFEKTYYSYQLGMRKPDSEIFQFVVNDNKLVPAETLFIDDTLMHVQGARKIGIDGYFLDLTKENLEMFLPRFLI